MCDDGLIQRFIVTIEGHGWTDSQEIELLKLPGEGEPIDTKFGTLIVERVEKTPEAGEYGDTSLDIGKPGALTSRALPSAWVGTFSKAWR